MSSDPEMSRLGYRVGYCVGRVDLENRTLVSCGGGLEAECVGGVDGCKYVGVDVGLVWVMEARR